MEMGHWEAFMAVTKNINHYMASLKRRDAAVKEAERASLVSRAAKAVDDIFRRRKTVPTCPHCHEPLLPEDMLRLSTCSADLARARREGKPVQRPTIIRE
jgi:hypothetical protein